MTPRVPGRGLGTLFFKETLKMDPNTLGVLARPFTDIKTRPGRSGQALSYIEGHAVVRRLNEAFGGDWDFRVLQHEVGQQEVIVLAELKAGGVIKHAFGGSELTRTKDGAKLVSAADDLKAAATDALKKAATLFGVGLHLYGEPEPPANVRPNGNGTNGNSDNGNGHAEASNDTGRLTRRQLAYITRLSQDKGMDRSDLESLSRAKFGRTTAYLSSAEASAIIQDLQQ